MIFKNNNNEKDREKKGSSSTTDADLPMHLSGALFPEEVEEAAIVHKPAKNASQASLVGEEAVGVSAD